MTPVPVIPQKVTKRQLRGIWNDPEFQAALLKRCTERVMVTERPAPPDAEQAPGTLSQVYDLFDNNAGELLGTFHRYRKPDGTLGASGKADPIFLLVNGVPTYDP